MEKALANLRENLCIYPFPFLEENLCIYSILAFTCIVLDESLIVIFFRPKRKNIIGSPISLKKHKMMVGESGSLVC